MKAKVMINKQEPMTGMSHEFYRDGLPVIRSWDEAWAAIHQIEMTPAELLAAEFAFAAHKAVNEYRQYTHEPYIVHPMAVARIVARVPHTLPMLQASWLHDVVENTPITLTEIHGKFGNDTADLVEMVTDISQPSDGNRSARKKIDREHTGIASPKGKTIKLADIIVNVESIIKEDIHFARTYIPEKILQLGFLSDGDAALFETAASLLKKCQAYILDFDSPAESREAPSLM